LVVVVGFLRTQQLWMVVFWVVLLVWVVVWGLFGCGCACEGGFFNMVVAQNQLVVAVFIMLVEDRRFIQG